MLVKNYQLAIQTEGFTDIIDISPRVIEILDKCKVKNGNVLVYAPGSTCGITTVEYESGCIEDLKEFFETIAPQKKEYRHDLKWGDGNGYAHIRAAFIKSGFSFPIIDNKAVLSPWQQIVLIDFDNRGRDRKVFVQIIGE